MPNLDPKLSAHMVQWGNSNTLYPDSLGNFQHHGIGFVNYKLLSDELPALRMGLFFLVEMEGCRQLLSPTFQRK